MNPFRFLGRLLAVSIFSFYPELHSAENTPHRIPVIFHTDIGTDIDDTWALAQILRSPELDLKLVLTDTGDTHHRAALVGKLLEVAGRTDVVIGIGIPGPIEQQPRNQEPWVKGYDLPHYPGKVVEDGVGALISVVNASDQPMTIISVSGATSIAAALHRDPSIAAKCRFVGMHGSVTVGYGGKSPAAEWNVKVDPAALRAVLAAPWRDILLTPLDTCGTVSLEGADYHALWCATADPLIRAVIENYCTFAGRVTWMHCDFFALRSTTLFDCVAVTLAHDEHFVETESIRLQVTDDGFTRRDSTGPVVRVALRWKDRAAWEHDLARRLLGR
jgi:inosine-uridine nucleoside N-ribohydrolase